jgi:Ca2+-transporting ATPase
LGWALTPFFVHIKGRGSGIVIATGVETEFGVIFSMMQDVCGFPTIPFNINQQSFAQLG